MKKVVICICLSLGFFFEALSMPPKKEPITEYLNFRVENNLLIWTKVFEMQPEDSVAVRRWFSKEFLLSYNEENEISGETRKEILPHKAVGSYQEEVHKTQTYDYTSFDSGDDHDSYYYYSLGGS